MKLIDIFEARRNPEQNPKLSLVDVLRKYKDDPIIFITFRSVPHLNINTRYEFNTPMGVYFYPLQAFWNHFKTVFENGKIPEYMYATKMRYCFISRYNGKGKKEIRDTNAYTNTDRMRDFDELRKLGYDVDNAFSRIPDNQYTQNEFGKFWNTLNVLTQHISGRGSLGTSLLALEKNKILRQLGYAYVSEPGGSGIIHPNEVEQGFFTSAAFIKTINMVDTQEGTDQKIKGEMRKKTIIKNVTERLHYVVDHAVDSYNDDMWAVEDEYGYDEDDEDDEDYVKPLIWRNLELTLNTNTDDKVLTIYQSSPDRGVLGYIHIAKFTLGKVTLECYDTDNKTLLITETLPAPTSDLEEHYDDYYSFLLSMLFKVQKNSKYISDFMKKWNELRGFTNNID